MLKKIAASVMAVLLTFGGVVPAATCADDGAGNAKIIGDMNGDKVVNTYDLIMLRQLIDSKEYIYGFAAYDENNMNMDLDNDGCISSKDADGLSDFLMGKPVPFAVRIGSQPLGKDMNIEAAEGRETDEKFAEPYMDFGMELFRRSAAENKSKNVLVSPVSVMTALAMTANGANGETLAEMEKVLGGELKMEDINEYLSYFDRRVTGAKYSTLNIANSIWFNANRNYDLKEEFLSTDMRYYNAPLYKVLFDMAAMQDVNNWVMKNTKGMIKKVFEDADEPLFEELAMCLINTLYFHGDWAKEYESTYKADFTDVNGNKKSVDFLGGDEYYYYETDSYTGFRKNYSGNEFSFVGILPNKGTDINEFIAGLDAEELLKTISKPIVPTPENEFTVIARMPEFKNEFSIKMKDMLSDMGMPSAFDEGSADFSGMTDEAKLYIDEVLHKTAIELNKNGTSAAAVTVIMAKETAAIMQPEKEIYVDMNRPFVYMIIDNKTSLPLFIGAVTEVNQG